MNQIEASDVGRRTSVSDVMDYNAPFWTGPVRAMEARIAADGAFLACSGNTWSLAYRFCGQRAVSEDLGMMIKVNDLRTFLGVHGPVMKQGFLLALWDAGRLTVERLYSQLDRSACAVVLPAGGRSVYTEREQWAFDRLEELVEAAVQRYERDLLAECRAQFMLAASRAAQGKAA